MNWNWRKAFVVACVLPSLAVGAPRADLNAFLDEPVMSTAQLVSQVKTKLDVRDRYMRHYGMTEIQLCSYLGSLRLIRLSRAEVVTVYSVPSSGAVRSHRQELRKGDLVFVDPSGHDVLLARCGNPLELGPANMLNMALGVPYLEGADVLAMKSMPDVNVDPVMMIDPRPAIAMNVPPDTLADVVSDLPPLTTTAVTAPTLPPPATATTPPVLTPPSAGGGNPGGIVGILPLLGGGVLIGILTSNPGAGGNPGSPPATPEPLAVVILAAGALSLRRRRHS